MVYQLPLPVSFVNEMSLIESGGKIQSVYLMERLFTSIHDHVPLPFKYLDLLTRITTLSPISNDERASDTEEPKAPYREREREQLNSIMHP